ncbi:DUF6090 family protein [Algoriphagus kandeliae]|nr:DUF6090 family protein [Algoriphagus kandeliae]
MLRFFRHIRQKMLQQHRLTRYLAYAVGEIVLVVIGILIALSINNWNDQKKARDFEVKMLGELQSTLKADLNYIENHLLGNRNQAELDAIDYFSDLLKKVNRDTDSLRYHWSRLAYGQNFRMNLGPYESLKSMGVEKISNDSLRYQIVRFYDFIFPRNRDLIQTAQDRVERDDDRLAQLMDDMTYELVDDEVIIDRPNPDPSIIYDPLFLEVLRNAERRTSWTIQHTNAVIEELNFLLRKINDELNK